MKRRSLVFRVIPVAFVLLFAAELQADTATTSNCTISVTKTGPATYSWSINTVKGSENYGYGQIILYEADQVTEVAGLASRNSTNIGGEDLSGTTTGTFSGVLITEGRYFRLQSFTFQLVSNAVVDTDYVWMEIGPPCGNVDYRFTVTNTSGVFAKKFVIFAEPTGDGIVTTLDEFTLGPTQSVVKTGTVPNFCGEVKIYELQGDEETPVPYAPPFSPPGPGPFPDPSGLPPPPTPSPTPDPAPAPPSPAPDPTPSPTPGTGTPDIIPTPDPTNRDIYDANTALQLDAIRRNTENTATGVNSTNKKLDYANDRLKRIDDNIAAIEARDEYRSARQKDIEDGIPGIDEMLARATAAAESVKSAAGTLPEAAVITVPSVSNAFQISMLGQTYDLNPFSESRFGPLAAKFRALIAWFVVMSFGIWASKNAREVIASMLASPQTRGNTVAGTGGQLTALLAAGLIAVILSTGVVAVVAWKETSLGGFTVTEMLATNPLAGATGSFAKVFWALDQIFPVVTILTAVVARITFQWICVLALIVTAVAIRFINP